jgi:hypothetical protein
VSVVLPCANANSAGGAGGGAFSDSDKPAASCASSAARARLGASAASMTAFWRRHRESRQGCETRLHASVHRGAA